MEGSAAGGSDLRRGASRLSGCGDGLRTVISEMLDQFLIFLVYNNEKGLCRRFWAPKEFINLVKDERKQKGVFLCSSCRITLRREPKSIPEIKNLDEAQNLPSSPAKSSSYTETSASSLLARAKRNAESLMSLLCISPLRASKFGDNCSMMVKKNVWDFA